jgi:hypothetical protein
VIPVDPLTPSIYLSIQLTYSTPFVLKLNSYININQEKDKSLLVIGGIRFVCQGDIEVWAGQIRWILGQKVKVSFLPLDSIP